MNKEKCCGCRACEQICPKKCIKIFEDKNGFLYPKIDEERCIHCNMCKKVCPMINSEKVKNKEGKAYALIHKDKYVIEHSSSGGAFTAIAESIANEYEGNYAIYGATMDKRLRVKHIGITNIEDIHLLQKSKYIQSDMKDVFYRIKDDLNANKTVLFVGTPCQVAAVKLYTQNIKKGKLILIDLVCHGVPSQKIFDQYIQSLEKKENETIVNYEFRKRYKLLNIIDSSSIMYTLEKEEKYKNIYKYSFEDEYMKAFYDGLTYRPSCYSCPFATAKRTGDITIADFWGIAKRNPKLNPQKGISLVTINNVNYNNLCEKLRYSVNTREEDYKLAIENNNSLRRPSKKNNYYEDFLRELNKGDFCEIVNKYVKKKSKIEFYIARILPENIVNKLRSFLKRSD